MCNRIQGKGRVTPQETCLWVSARSLWQRHGSVVACGRLGALTVAVHAWDLLREVTIIFITSTIVWPQVNNRGNTAPPINKIGLKIY